MPARSPPCAADASATTTGDAEVETAPADAQIAVVAIDAPVVAAPADAQVAAGPRRCRDRRGQPRRPARRSRRRRAGARVFLDGADTGVTPVKLPGSRRSPHDRAAAARPRALRRGGRRHGRVRDHAQGGHAARAAPPASRSRKCKDKDRYYVFVDGKPTGQTVPDRAHRRPSSARTPSRSTTSSPRRRKTCDIVVKDTRLSVRVKIE